MEKLKDDTLPRPPHAIASHIVSPSESNEESCVSAVLDAEGQVFFNGFRAPNNQFMASWLPRYRQTIDAIAKALCEDKPEELFDTFWKTADNHIAHAGQGLLKYDVVDGMRTELIQVVRDIYMDGSPANFARIVKRFEAWKAEGRIRIVPRLLIARAFAGVHPHLYHTTVDASSQRKVLHWFIEHSGFAEPNSASWSEIAHALVTHLDRLEVFDGDILARNIFPWFVMDQLRAPSDILPGHSPRALSAYGDLPPTWRAIALRHNIVQTALFARLAAQYGSNKVWTEYPTGTGGYADAIARESDGRCVLYEIKIADTAAEVVRQAMGQLLEYGFRKGGLEPWKLVAVGEPILDEFTKQFIARLSTDFKLNFDYLQIVL